MKSKSNYNQLKKFLSGTGTVKEMLGLLRRMKSEDFDNEMKDRVEDLWESTSEMDKMLTDFNNKEVLNNILNDIEKPQAQLKKIEVGNVKRKKGIYRRRFAAVVVLLVASSIATVFFHFEPLRQAEKSGTVLLTKSTQKGEKLSFSLDDGSKVYLNANSELTFEKHFSGDVRRVKLIGEAFFEVTRDTLRPFYVEANTLTTEVLGTSFNVKAYPGEPSVTVALHSGMVRLMKEHGENMKDAVTLEPGKKAMYDTNSKSIRLSGFSYDQEIGWKDGLLYFDDARFDEIVEKLEDWYGVEIIVENQPPADKPFTGQFANENLQNVLYGLSFSKSFDFKITGKNVKIKFKQDDR